MSEPDDAGANDSPSPQPSPPKGVSELRTPRWVTPFLRALGRTGQARSAAEDAGIDHTTAYLRRRTHGEFAAAWEAALKAHAVAKARTEEEEIAAVRAGTSPPLPPVAPQRVPPSPAEGGGASSGEELVSAGAQLKRAGHDKWSKRKEKAFFDALAATANVKRAAAAAGVSTNAVYARRMKQPLFRVKWAAVLETGRAAIEMKLVEAANKSFDADELDVGEVEPKVTVAEAIRIVQHGGKTQRDALPDPFQQQAEAMHEDDLNALRERLIRKLQRLAERRTAERLEEGWSFDEGFGHLVPPGWAKG